MIGERSTPENDSTHKVCEDTLTEKFEDGYRWSTYGRTSEEEKYICDYYMCTKANCSARRKIIRLLNEKTIKIEYVDIHNHPKPPNVGTTFRVDGLLEKDLDKREVHESLQITGTYRDRFIFGYYFSYIYIISVESLV